MTCINVSEMPGGTISDRRELMIGMAVEISTQTAEEETERPVIHMSLSGTLEQSGYAQLPGSKRMGLSELEEPTGRYYAHCPG